jgi:hypothetical protein
MPFRASRLLPALLLCAAGCQILPELPRSTGGELTLTGRTVLAKAQTVLESDDHPALTFPFDRAWYASEGKQSATFVLVQGDEAKPTAAALVRVLWRPVAGSTPIDEHASNATVHLMRFGASQTEVWSGAGFVFLKDKPKHPYMSAQCWNADIMLLDATPGAQDTLGTARAEGDFTADYAPEQVAKWVERLGALEKDKLPAK